MSGELNESGLLLFSNILQNVFVPLVKGTHVLKDVLTEDQAPYLAEMEKCAQVCRESILSVYKGT